MGEGGHYSSMQLLLTHNADVNHEAKVTRATVRVRVRVRVRARVRARVRVRTGGCGDRGEVEVVREVGISLDELELGPESVGDLEHGEG